jgi:hypothetical protein
MLEIPRRSDTQLFAPCVTSHPKSDALDALSQDIVRKNVKNHIGRKENTRAFALLRQLRTWLVTRRTTNAFLSTRKMQARLEDSVSKLTKSECSAILLTRCRTKWTLYFVSHKHCLITANHGCLS